MKVVVGSDHAGYDLKEVLKKHLVSKGVEVLDAGANGLDSVDYPEYGQKVSKLVVNDNYDFGIVVCGTGIGISIAANKVKGARAALVYDLETARLAKQHNNANVIAFGGRMPSAKIATDLVDEFIKTDFELRHQKRVSMLEDLNDSK